jgi:2-hydroxychromene-2-carboxylate isomerase
VRIDEFTDPGCPWAYSAEPFRRRLNWLYEGRIEWVPRMVVLADTAADYAERGYTPEFISDSGRRIAHEHGMPIDTRLRPRVPGTRLACQAVVAARVVAGADAARVLLRRLRVRNFSGELLDEPETIEGAAGDAGLDPHELERWLSEPRVEEELREDMVAARRPMAAARVLDHKLANWSGGRRYTCPSYEIERLEDGVTISVPGFQPFNVYDVILANLVPGLDRRAAPGSVEEVLAWAGTPLATKEVAVVCDIAFDRAREELGRVAVEHHVGADGFWTLPHDAPAANGRAGEAGARLAQAGTTA